MRSLKPSWRSRTYQVRTHIDSTSDQGIKNYHSLTEQKTRYWHNDAKSHKACLVLVFNLAELNRSFLALDKLRSRGSLSQAYLGKYRSNSQYTIFKTGLLDNAIQRVFIGLSIKLYLTIITCMLYSNSEHPIAKLT